MRKYYKFILLVVFFSVFLISKTYAAEVESCESLQNRDACNSSTEDGVSCKWYEDGSANGCAKATTLASNLSSTAESCIDFKEPDYCNLGIGKDGSRFGCAWNDKYNFCSPNGLAYLACGEGDSAAHDIPQFLPRITSYAIAILKTVTPVILIIMSMVQIIKAIASQNEDEMKKARSALVKKLIAATLIFFVTTIVQFVIKKAADGSEFASVNNCLSCFVNNDCDGALYFVDGYGNCYDVDSKSQVDCDTTIGVKPRGWVEAAGDSSSDDSSGGSPHGGVDF